VTLRRLLFALAAVAAVFLIGLPVVLAVLPPGESVDAPSPVAPDAAPAPIETVQIGAEGPPPAPAVEIPDLVEINRQTATVVRAAEPAVVYVEVTTGPPDVTGRVPTEAGSGVIISPSGYVVTNDHVVARAEDVLVYLPTDKREYRAEVVGRDPTTDIAVLRLLEVGVGSDPPLPVASLGDSDALEVGEWVLAVGSPFRLANTATMGIVSALGRGGIQAIESDFAIEDFIQTDAAINQGNSGGALVNLRGEVVGVVTAIASESGYYEGYGFAVPMNLARRVTEDLIQYGEVRRGYLGVEVLPVSVADARERGMAGVEGVLVYTVADGGPAARAGLRPGDVLLEVGGRPIDEPNQFQSRLAMARPSEPIALTVWREGERAEMEAVLADPRDPRLEEFFATREPVAAPPAAPPGEGPVEIGRSEAPDWGVRFRDLTRSERRRFEAGALVESVDPGSAAELDGLPPGTVVVEVEDRPVATAEDARLALARQARRDEPALLRVRRPDGRTAFYDLASPFVD
jgi:serine protease Do